MKLTKVNIINTIFILLWVYSTVAIHMHIFEVNLAETTGLNILAAAFLSLFMLVPFFVVYAMVRLFTEEEEESDGDKD